jgi:tetratricopeptide (TPR) repeat protein
VRRLILATGQQLRKVSFRSGEGTRHRGWDGVVKANEGTPFVPAGVSGWELGTGKDVRRKAQEDYQKRTRNPGVLKPKRTTFVFVTPRRWRDKQEWAQERRRKGKWRDVWVHDADDLETWLEQAPAVHVWLSIRLGKRPADVLDLETHWKDWNAAHGRPPFDKEVVTRIHRWLGAEPASLPWPADSRGEAIAIFAAALLDSLPEEERTSLLSRTVVVRSEQALRVLADRSCPLIFVVDFEVDALAVADATRKGHHVLVPVGQEAPLRPVVPRSLPGSLTPGNLLKALQAPYRLVEFTGKDHRALCKGIAGALKGLEPHPSRAWILWGPGGAGKTRTAVEVALALEEKGWLAFFVDFHPSPPEDRLQHLFIRCWPNWPILLIVDYAEQRPADDLQALARAVREAVSKRSAPLALLFLMRANPWEPAAGHVAVALNGARIRWEDRMVRPIEDPADRQELFYKARERFRDGLAPPDAPPEVGYNPEGLPRTPLAILALAILAAHGHRVAKSENEVAVLTALWEQWEQSRWKRTLEAQGGKEPLETPEVWEEARERIEQALAAATLGRPFAAPDEVAAWWEAHFPFQARTAHGDRLDPHWLAQRLQALFPAAEDRWHLPSISPDPLADVVLARLGADLGRLVASILPTPEEVRADTHWPIRMVVEVLPRLGDAAVPGAREAALAALEAATRWLEKTAQALPEDVTSTWLRMWDKALPPPDRTVLLRPFEEAVYRIWAGRATDDAERAPALGMWGYVLSALDRWEEALKATQEAVELFLRLGQQKPLDFLPELAVSLHNLGNQLSEAGWREKALQVTRKAVRIYRWLVKQNPRAFLPDLAKSLNSLSNRLSELGQRKEALQVTRKAVRISRWLVKQNPRAFRSYLAMSLNNLGNRLSELGRQEEALKATRKAVRIYRRLADQNPQAFLPGLAMSLNNLGARLSALDRWEEARKATLEAVEIYRRLVRQTPGAFLPELAMSLNNLGAVLSELGQQEEALQATLEAVKTYHQLADQNPRAFRPYLAMSLNNLGNWFFKVDRWEEALQTYEEAIRTLLPFFRALPTAFADRMQTMVENYLRACRKVGKTPDAGLMEELRRAGLIVD